MQRVVQSRTNCLSKHPFLMLPENYEDSCLEKMTGMLDERVSKAGYKFDSEDDNFIKDVEYAHKAMLSSLNDGHYEHADVIIGYLLQNNLLIFLAQKLVGLQVKKFKNVYKQLPDATYFHEANKLFVKCNSIWRNEVFNHALSALRDRGHTAKSDDLYPLLERFSNSEFVEFLIGQISQSIPQAKPIEPVKPSYPVSRFFKPEMMYLETVDIMLECQYQAGIIP